jgi:hypothetical protein
MTDDAAWWTHEYARMFPMSTEEIRTEPMILGNSYLFAALLLCCVALQAESKGMFNT